MQTDETANKPATDIKAGLLDRNSLSSQFNGISERTINRYEQAGMPVIAVGILRLYDPTRVREWLLTQQRGHGTPPKRGRPRKAA